MELLELVLFLLVAIVASSLLDQIVRGVSLPLVQIALGAGIGAVIGLPWAAAWPGSEVAAFAFIGAAAFLGASMNAPFTGLILVIEFTAQGPTILVPAALAVGGATAATAWLTRRTRPGA